MTRFRRHLASVLAVALAAVHLGCGSDGLVLPEEGDAATIAAMGGDDQSGPAGGTLPQPLVVRVTDARGRPVANQDVSFTPDAGAGSAEPATAKTDAEGKVSSVWTLGPSAGTQQLVARATGGTAPANLSVTFSATAVSGSAAGLQVVSGDGQSGAVGSALPESLVVKVTDGQGNPVAGVEVSWTVAGGGSISPDKVTTGTDGRAAAERVLGPTAGEQTAQASAAGLSGSPVTFTQTAVAANPDTLIKVSGDGQSAPAGFPLADSLVVRLVDPNGNGIGGRSVTWVVGSGEGSVNPVNSVTTPQGYAITRWTMPSAAGTYSIDAVFSGLQPVAFSGTATADAPTTLEMVSGDGQSATVGSPLAQPLRVKVTDANDNAVENVSVTWTANGGGSVSSGTTGTNANGIAEVTRTLGLTPGPYTTTASVEGLSGSPITFTSTANVGLPAKLAILTQPSSTAQSGVPLAQQPVIQLQDAFGNNVAVSGRAVSAGVIGGSVTGGTAATDATGKASFTALAIVGTAGQTFQVTFTSGTLIPVTSSDVTLGAGSATKLVVATAPSADVQAGVVFPQQPVIQLQDGGGNPVALAGVNVTVDISNGGGTLDGTKTVATDNDGQAHFTNLAVSGSTGQRTLRFRAAPLTQTTATVNVGAGPAAKIEAASVVTQSGSPSQAVANPPAVRVSDQFDNVVDAVSVTFQVTAGGGSITPSSPVSTGSDGIAALNSWTLGPSAGENTVTASSGSLTGSPVTFTANASATATTTEISAAPSSSVVGQSVDFTVTVSGSGGTPSGNVTLTVDGVERPAQALSSGSTVFSVTFTTAETHNVGASYSGAGQFAGSTATPLSYSVGKAATSVALQSDNAAPTEGETIAFTATVTVNPPGAGQPGGTVQFKDNGSVLGSPQAVDGSGTAVLQTTLPQGPHSITAEYSGDGNFEPAPSAPLDLTVDPPPNSVPISMSDGFGVPEDNLLNPDPGGGVLANDSDPDDDPLTAVLVAPPSHASDFALNPNGSFSYQPVQDYNGVDQFTYRASDGTGTSDVATVTITVNPVNDPPSFTAGPDQSITVLDGAQSVNGWATAISPGPADESGQTVDFIVSVNSGELLFLSPPAVSSDGTLSYTPSGLPGEASISVSAHDDGGTANGGDDTGDPQTFTITISP